jgi:hypothetical protein
MSAFGFLLFPQVEDIINVNLFPTQLRSAIARFENQLTPLRFRGRKRKYERHQLQIYKGDTETLIIQVTLQDEPFDLSNYQIRAQIREKVDSEDFIHDIIIQDGDNNTVLTEGHLVWRIPSTDTEKLPIKCIFDIRAYQNDEVSTVCSGIFERVDDVTK